MQYVCVTGNIQCLSSHEISMGERKARPGRKATNRKEIHNHLTLLVARKPGAPCPPLQTPSPKPSTCKIQVPSLEFILMLWQPSHLMSSTSDFPAPFL
ncbi:hypothetical protein VTJ04DRAFT_10523 [Mycothermus thermophilus]|uniref:uncharacterized protein n=1 Tax=Humicola insolens TaxID=85995 RepID=UPI0037424CC0